MTPGRSGGPDLDQPDSLTVRFDSVIASLYDALPLQDQNSGVRFPPGGEKDLADHKDWLFRKREVRLSPMHPCKRLLNDCRGGLGWDCACCHVLSSPLSLFRKAKVRAWVEGGLWTRKRGSS